MLVLGDYVVLGRLHRATEEHRRIALLLAKSDMHAILGRGVDGEGISLMEKVNFALLPPSAEAKAR
jgi:hypothetical protein